MADYEEQLKRASEALTKMKQRMLDQEAKMHEPIAIIGSGCRFPGNVSSLQQFWQLLSRGEDGIVDVPADRWDMETLYDEQPGAAGKLYTRQAGFIEQPGHFEPEFFGISPREAKSMDPQQRLLLEVVWEALEHANIVPETLRESDTGMYLGIGQNDYGLLQLYGNDYQRINTYDGSGNGFCFAAGRISYAMGWHGPALSVDTACSSSLVAVHLACQSLRKGECRVAVAAGVQLMLTPNVALFLSRVGALAADGRSKAFAAKADGYGRGEGCGALVLKRLSEARRDGDDIIAVIKASAINHDGPGSGLTVPNGLAQQQLIEQTLTQAKIKPAQVAFVEAHGTGTVLGDPIEAEALGHVYGAGRQEDSPLFIGSVKTNIGHLEAAAGIAGIIKTALALQHNQIPASLGFTQPNPHIHWQRLRLHVPTELTPLPVRADGIHAGVSSFGMSGTNAHIILQQYDTPPEEDAAPRNRPYWLTLAAKTLPALKAQCISYANALNGLSDSQAADFCLTANTARSHFAYRAAFTHHDPAQLVEQLRDPQRWQQTVSPCKEWQRPKLALVFTGQGSQYTRMGHALYQTEPVFRDAVDTCERMLAQQDMPSIKTLLCEIDSEELLKTQAQPAIFVFQYALLALWQSWGIKADYLLGHSIGEYAAACHAGVFSVQDALRLIGARTRCIDELALPGGMIAVSAPSTAVQPLVAAYADQAAIAAVNTADSCVVSGVHAVLELIMADLERAGLSYVPLQVAHAFHSPAMQPALQKFAAVAETISYTSPNIPLISTLTGNPVSAEIATPEYWTNHIRQAVQFYPAICELAAVGPDIVLEIGPRPVLTHLLSRIDETAGIDCIAGQSGKGDNVLANYQAAAQLYQLGVTFDWEAISGPGRKMRIPTYPWQRKFYWVETASKAEAGHLESSKILQSLANGDIENLLAELAPPQSLTATEQTSTLALLNRLHQLHQRDIGRKKLQQLSYRIGWQPEQLPEAADDGATWLLISDREGRAEKLFDHCCRNNRMAILVEPGDAYQNITPQRVRLRFGSEDDWRRFFDDYADKRESLNACIHFGFCGLAADTGGCADAERALFEFVLVYRTLIEPLAIRLSLITANAQAVTSTDTVAGWLSATAWGLGRVIGLEQPERLAGLIDLDDNDAQTAPLVARIVASATRGEQLALRSGVLYRAHLSRHRLPEGEFDVTPNADYLVTGGLGGLGLAVAEWLANRSAGRIWLVARRSADGETLNRINTLRQAGADIRCVQADISDSRSVEELMQQITAQGNELKGVIHAAGVLRDALLTNVHEQDIADGLAAKVRGAWLLHQATRELKLDFFVLFSSAASVLGSTGQSIYAAANAAVDALAAWRHEQQLPALTLNWGAWAEIGMAAALSPADKHRMEAGGVIPMKPEDGLLLLGHALASPETQHVLMDIDWKALRQAQPHAATQSFWPMLGGNREEHPQQQEPLTQGVDFATRVRELNPQEAHRFAREQVESILKKVLYLDADAVIDQHQGFFDMGLDSITVVEFRDGLARHLRSELPPTLLFEYVNVDEVCTFLLNQSGATQGDDTNKPSQQQSPIADIQDLSEEDLDRLISEKLDSLE